MKNLPIELILILAAFLAGMASYAQKYIDTKTFIWIEFVSHLVISIFSAYLFTTVAMTITDDFNVIQIFNAIGAFTGIKGITWMQTWFRSKFLST